ncbi:MAG TPA: hypothetical protein RMH99_02685 [Sandaracinaceae bacterium LLY-WYZ-13_1]|nr:hypothetical protein [Sandaracinaceae bacterium LLY-WYZ-13_1]
MPYPKTKDAERVKFIATPGSKKLYQEVATLEGLHLNGWIRETLHREAKRVLEAHGRDTSNLPPVHLERPPRLQPPLFGPEDDDEEDEPS